MAIARALRFKIRSAITFGLVLSLSATGVVILQPAAAAGTPLLAIGNDVVSADALTATYRIEVRNAGNGEATNVRVTLPVPARTTFESSSPPASPVEGGTTPTCDNEGTREPGDTTPPTKCEWLLGLLPGGAVDSITVILNLLPTGIGVTAAPEVTGTNPSTGDAIPKQTDSDSSLVRQTLTVSHDTWVGRTEPRDTNHGGCPVLRTAGDGTSTAFVDFAFAPPISGAVEKVWAADLKANVAASDYSASAPGSLALHAIKSGDWTEETGPCEGGTLTTGASVRTGSEPGVESVPTATTSVSAPGPISMNVLGDLDGAAERSAFQGWEIRNTTGFGSANLHSKQATPDTFDPTVVVILTTPETAKCIDVDPDFSVGFPTSEQIVRATVYDSPTTKVVAGTNDGCNGTPVAAQLVNWKMDKDRTPDAYFSNQAGTQVPKSGTAPDEGPNSIDTTTSEAGLTFVGIRLANPLSFNGENRVAGCINPCAEVGTAAEPEMCTPAESLSGCTKTGESNLEDDATLQWSTAAPEPAPSESAPPQGPPRISGFSPTSGPIGTSVVVNGDNFTGTTAVRFNGTAAAFMVDSPTQITTTVPTGATDGPISVRNPAGTAMSAANFDVTPRPASSSPPANRTTTPPTSSSNSPGASGSPGSTVGSSGLSPVSLTLAPSADQTIAFTEVTLSGSLTSDNPTCAQPGTTVELFKREAESTTLEHLAYVNTAVGGLFEHKLAPEANTIYVASIDEHDVCAGTDSTPVTVLVAPEVTIKSTATKVDAGRRFWITGKVLPEHQLTAVTLWRKVSPTSFEKIDKAFLDAASRYSFSVKYVWRKRARSKFVVRWKTTDADHISGKSAPLVIQRSSSDPSAVTVSISSTKGTLEAGERFRITGSVRPRHPQTPVTLWRKTGSGKFKRLAVDHLNERSRYSFALRYRWKRAESIFVVRWRSADADHMSAKSPLLRIERA